MSSKHLLAAALLLTAGAALSAEPQQTGFGRPATKAEIEAADIDVRADGTGLPPGHGSVEEGATIFATQCAACHGTGGEAPINASLRLTGGRGTLTMPSAVMTVGSYWPYAPTLFDYIRRAMPFNAPRSLTDDQVYAVTAYVLRLNDIVADRTVLDAASLSQVRMPNRDGFVNAYKPGN